MAVEVVFKPAAFPDPPETVVLEFERKCGARRSGTDTDLCVFVGVPGAKHICCHHLSALRGILLLHRQAESHAGKKLSQTLQAWIPLF